MPNIQPVGASSKVNMLIHADIGAGKTKLIGSGGKDFKILMMRPPTEHPNAIVGSGVQEIVVRNWEEIWDGLEYARHNGQEWDWFWMDSISLLQDTGLDDVYENMLDTKGPAGSEARRYREKFGPDRGEYGVNMWRLGQWVRHMVGAEIVNLGITAHSFWWEPDDGVTPSALWPWVQGKMMPQKICGMMNIVGYMAVEERTVRGQTRMARVIHWDKTPNYYAKNTFLLPDGTSTIPSGITVNPTLPQIYEAISKGRPVIRGTRRGATVTPIARNRRARGR